MMLKSIRTSTDKQYTTYINKFVTFCRCHKMPLINVEETFVINFLQSLYDSDGGYSLINTASSAVNHFLNLIGNSLKSTAMISKFKKGVFNSRPALPKYCSTWDPQIVLDYFDTVGDTKNDDILFLASKSVTLLALASCVRVSTLQSLRYEDITFTADKLCIRITQLQKQTRPGYHQSAIELERYSISNHCVVEALERYIRLTNDSRKASGSNIYITTTKPYKDASVDTVARWIKNTIHKAGISVNFTAHSTRSASTSDLSNKGIDIKTILEKAGWSSINTFYKFYRKPINS